MHTYIALLRGINVGGRNVLPMKTFASLLGAMGFANVRTYIQSGNALLQSAAPLDAGAAGRIARHIGETHGFVPQVLLLEAAALHAAIAANPFPTDDGKALHFYFLQSPPVQPDIARLNALKAGSEAFELGRTVFYLYAPEGIGRSKLAAAAESALKVPTTARNWNTVRKLASMVGER